MFNVLIFYVLSSTSAPPRSFLPLSPHNFMFFLFFAKIKNQANKQTDMKKKKDKNENKTKQWERGNWHLETVHGFPLVKGTQVRSLLPVVATKQAEWRVWFCDLRFKQPRKELNIQPCRNWNIDSVCYEFSERWTGDHSQLDTAENVAVFVLENKAFTDVILRWSQ